LIFAEGLAADRGNVIAIHDNSSFDLISYRIHETNYMLKPLHTF
jgi:hypothetical protein